MEIEGMETENVKKTKKSGNGRNTEKRRERSKVAARCRRSKESEIFSELCDFLPLPESTRNSLDKASIMRLSLSDLKLRHMMENVFAKEIQGKVVQKDYESKEGMRLELDSCMSNAMGGFLIVIATDGDIVYVTESVTTHLGLSQVELMGLSIYDFSHPCDHADIKELVGNNKKDEHDDCGSREGSFRMKCTITSRGRNVHLRAATYKVIEFTGRMFASDDNNPDKQWFVGIGEPLFHPSDVDIPLNKQTFLTKHSPDMKCSFVDDSILSFVGYKQEDMIGKSIFEFFHAADGPALGKAFKSLYSKGQAVTERYRFLAKYGGWVWVVTQATLIQGANGSKPNSIVCLNFVTSGIENEEEILSAVQTLPPVCKPFELGVPEFKRPIVLEPIEEEEIAEKENIVPPCVMEPAEPITSTKAVIAPRTEDMDTGFLMPCDNTLIVSKEEPDDLTHLAPIAGDTCVPLEMGPVPILENLLKELEAAKLPFALNESELDLTLENYTFTREADSADEKSPSYDSDACKDSASETSSPLFLHSDPMVMSPGSTTSLLSPFQLSPALGGHRSVDNGRYMSEFSSPSSSMPELSPASYRFSGEDTSSPPGVCGLTIDEEAFNPVMLQNNSANLNEISGSFRGFSSEGDKGIASGIPSNTPALDGAFITLPDGRKFPVVLTSNPNQLVCHLDVNTYGRESNNVKKNDIQIFLDGKGPSPMESTIGEQKLFPPAISCKNVEQSPHPEYHQFLGLDKYQSLNVDLNSPILRGSALPSIAEALFGGDHGPPSAKAPRMSNSRSYGENSSTIKKTAPFGGSATASVRSGETLNRRSVCSGASLPFQAEIHELSSPVEPPWENQEQFSTTSLTGRVQGQGSGFDVKSHLNLLLEQGRVDEVRDLLSTIRNYRQRSNPAQHAIFMKNMIQGFVPVNTSTMRKRDNQGNVLTGTARQTVRLDASQFPNLFELTRRDCEVNAPLSGNSSLLSGTDLLTALDTSVDPFA